MGAEMSSDRYDFENRYQSAYGPYSQEELMEYARAEKERLNAQAAIAPAPEPQQSAEPQIDERDLEMMTTYSGYLRSGGVSSHHHDKQYEHERSRRSRKDEYSSRYSRSRRHRRSRSRSYEDRRRYKSSRRRSRSDSDHRRRRRTRSDSPRRRSRRRSGDRDRRSKSDKKKSSSKVKQENKENKEQKKTKKGKKKKKKKVVEKEHGQGPWKATHDYFNSIENANASPWMNKGFPAVPVVAVSPNSLDPQYLSYIQDSYGLMTPKQTVDGMGYPVTSRNVQDYQTHQKLVRRASSLDSLRNRSGPKSVPHWPSVGQRLGQDKYNKNATMPGQTRDNHATAAMLYHKRANNPRGQSLPAAYRYNDEHHMQSSSLVESIPPQYKKPPNYSQPVAKPRKSLPSQASPQRRSNKHKPRKITARTAREDLENMLSSEYKMDGQRVGRDYMEPILPHDASLYQANKAIYVDDVMFSTHNDPISPQSISDIVHDISYDEFSLNSSSDSSIKKVPFTQSNNNQKHVKAKKGTPHYLKAEAKPESTSKPHRKSAANQTDKIHLIMPTTAKETKTENKEKTKKVQSPKRKVKNNKTQTLPEMEHKTVQTKPKQQKTKTVGIQPRRSYENKATKHLPESNHQNRRSYPRGIIQEVPQEKRVEQYCSRPSQSMDKKRRQKSPTKQLQDNRIERSDRPISKQDKGLIVSSNHPNLEDLPPQVYYLVPLSSKEVFIDDNKPATPGKSKEQEVPQQAPYSVSESFSTTVFSSSDSPSESTWSSLPRDKYRRGRHSSSDPRRSDRMQYRTSSSESTEERSYIIPGDSTTNQSMTLSVSESIKASSFISGNNKVFCITKSRSSISSANDGSPTKTNKQSKQTNKANEAGKKKKKKDKKEKGSTEEIGNGAEVGQWVLDSISQQSDSTVVNEEDVVPKTAQSQEETVQEVVAKNFHADQSSQTINLNDSSRNKSLLGPVTDVDLPNQQHSMMPFMNQSGPFYPAIPITFTAYPPPGQYYNPQTMGQYPPANPYEDPRMHQHKRQGRASSSMQGDSNNNPFQTSGDWNRLEKNPSKMSKHPLQHRRFSASYSSEVYAMAKPETPDEPTTNSADEVKLNGAWRKGDGIQNPNSDDASNKESMNNQGIDNVKKNVLKAKLEHQSDKNIPHNNENLDIRNSIYKTSQSHDLSKPVTQETHLPRVYTFPTSAARKLSITYSPIPEDETNPFRNGYKKSLDDYSPDVKEMVQKLKSDGYLEGGVLTNSELDLVESLTKASEPKNESLQQRASRILGTDQHHLTNSSSSMGSEKKSDKGGSTMSLNDALYGKIDTGTKEEQKQTQNKEDSNKTKATGAKGKKKSSVPSLNVEALMAFTGNHPKYPNRRPSLNRSRSPNIKQKRHSPPPFTNAEESSTSFKTASPSFDGEAFSDEDNGTKKADDTNKVVPKVSSETSLNGRDSCTVDVSDSVLESSVHYKVKKLATNNNDLPPPPKEYLLPETVNGTSEPDDNLSSYSKNIYSTTPSFHERGASLETTASEDTETGSKMGNRKSSKSSVRTPSISSNSAPLTSAELNIVKELQNGVKNSGTTHATTKLTWKKISIASYEPPSQNNIIFEIGPPV